MARILGLDEHMINLYAMQSNRKKGTNYTEIEQMKRFLSTAMEHELTKKQRKYVVGYFIDGKKMKQLADENNVSESNVSKIIKRAINTLKARSIYLNL